VRLNGGVPQFLQKLPGQTSLKAATASLHLTCNAVHIDDRVGGFRII